MGNFLKFILILSSDLVIDVNDYFFEFISATTCFLKPSIYFNSNKSFFKPAPSNILVRLKQLKKKIAVTCIRSVKKPMICDSNILTSLNSGNQQ